MAETGLPPPPDEREITKQQLWERINTAVETIASVSRDMMNNINLALPSLQRQNEISLAEFKNTLKSALTDMQGYIDVKIKFIEKLNNDGYSKMQNLNLRNQEDLDKRMQSAREDIDAETSQRIQKSYIEISKEIAEFHDEVIQYKKDTEKQMNSLQNEMSKKMGNVESLLKSVQAKFKKISEQIQ